MKRWIHAASEFQKDPDGSLSALQDIFSEYGLLVEYYPGTKQYVVHPENWPWPYYYCRAIKFGDVKSDGDDILVPYDYLDGKNTTLPQSAIDKAVKAANRAQAKIDERATTYPKEWPSSHLSGKFINMLTDYLYDDVTAMNKDRGVKFELDSILPEYDSEAYYDDIATKKHVAVLPYVQWLKDMHNIATSASDRSQFKKMYLDYLDDCIS